MVLGLCRFTNALNGTADFIYPGPAIDMQSPATAGAVSGVTYVYYAQSFDMTEWEEGKGALTFSAGTWTLARTTVTANSLGTTAKINFTNPPQIIVFEDLQTTIALASAAGQCKLVYVSATSISLLPFNGNQIFINGALYTISDAGVSITNSGLAASTIYYVYAYISSGVVALELSTTGHVKSNSFPNNGREIKSGDATRTLVGMVFTNVSSQFVDSVSQRFVRSWFNESGSSAYQNSSGRISTTSASIIELEAAVRSSILLWSGEKYDLSVICDCWNNTASAVIYFSCWVAAAVGLAPRIQTNGTGGQWYNMSAMHSDVSGADSVLTLGVGGATSAGTVNYDNKITRIKSSR